MPKTFSVSEQDKKDYATIYLLDRMINGRKTFPLLLEGQDKDLEPVLENMMTHDLVDIHNNSTYTPSAKGRKALVNFKTRYTDFLRNFDVFCAVDLESGNFAFEKWFDYENEDLWDQYLSEDRWEDLRVAAADFKQINPVEIVFMSFINEGRFDDTKEGWQFDLLLGSAWDELLEICNSALVADDLGYENDEGEAITGIDVMKDVLKEGAELNDWIREEEAKEPSAPPPIPPPLPNDPIRVERVHEPVFTHDIYDEYRRDPYYAHPSWKRRKKWWDWD